VIKSSVLRPAIFILQNWRAGIEWLLLTYLNTYEIYKENFEKWPENHDYAYERF